MSWNYRIARRVEPHGQEGLRTRWYSFGVYEVFYEKGVAHSIAYNPEILVETGDSECTLVKTIGMIAEDAKKRPAIDFHTLKRLDNDKKAREDDTIEQQRRPSDKTKKR